MKVLEILRSHVGAISKKALLSTGLAGGMMVLNVYNYVTNKPEALEPKIRSLSQIISSGGELPSEYSGISLSASGVDFATAEEQAAHEGAFLAKFDGGEAQVEALDKIDALNVRGSVFRGGEAGLGFNQGAVEIGPDGASNGGGASANGDGVGDAVAEANKTVINKLSEAKSSLPRASMARVNAGGSSSSYSPYGNTGNTNGGPSVPATKVGPASISGAPTIEGTTLVSAPVNLRGATGSDFVAPSRNFRNRGGGLSSPEAESLKRIATESAEDAKLHRQAHRVLMAQERTHRGPTMVDEDFSNNTNSSLGLDDGPTLDDKLKRLGQKTEEINTEEIDRKNHRSRLSKNMFLLILGTIAVGFAINGLMKEPPWGCVAAAALGVMMVAFIGLYIADCVKYLDKYGKEDWAIVGIVMGVLMLAAIAVSFFDFSSQPETLESTAASQMGTEVAATGAEAGAAGAEAAASGGSKLLTGLGNAAMGMGAEKAFEGGLSSGDAVLNGDDKPTNG